MKSGLMGLAALALPLAGGAAERVVYQEEFDRFGAVVPAFNAGAGLAEVKNGTQCLKYEPTMAGEFRSGCFKVGEPPKEREWKMSFLYRFDRKDIPNDFTLKLLFGDRSNPDVRTLTVSEAGSHFGCDAVPPPKDGMRGFLANGQWNKGAITVKDGRAAFWCWRGGELTKECETDFPAKPLVGWNLAMLSEKGGQVRFDRMAVTDGTDRPYDRGDPTEWLQEPQDAGLAWDAAFGTDATKPVAVDFAKNRLGLRFRRSDFPMSAKGRKERYEPIAVRFDLAKGKPRQILLTPADVEVKIADRRFDGGAFSNVVEKTKLAAEWLTVTGDPAVMARERILVRPSVREMDHYLPREINEIFASYGKLPKLANRVFDLEVVGLGGNRYRVFVDSQVLCELKTDEPVVSVSVAGAEARAALLPRGETDPQVYRLPLAKGGFKLERVRENQGSYWLECNGYLQRNGFDRAPDACVFNVPRRQWVRAKARCHVDPTAPATAVPVITARLTHFERNGGRSLAMCEQTVDLRDANAKVRKTGDEYEVTFDFDIGSIQDLTSMEDGLTRRELAYLSFEFTGPLWEKNRYYMDPYRVPAEGLVSSLIVTAGELEASPADFTAVANRPFSLYYPDETAGATVTVTPRVAGEYTVIAEVRDETGTVVERQEIRTSGTGKTSRTVGFEAKAFGYYDVDYVLKDGEGREVQRHAASFGRIRPDTRKAGYESPYYSWNFRGAHGTPHRMEDWAEAYRRLGIRRTTLAGRFTGGNNRELREDSPECRKYGITQVQFPYFRTPPAQRNAAGFTNLVQRMKTAMDMYPHCRTALVFHESGFGPFPKEIYGEATEVDDAVREKDLAKASEAEFCARAWRTADPTVKLIHGNSSSSIGLISRLLRAGYPKDLVDAWGEEDVGMTHPPEMSTALLPWEIKKAARLYSYTEAFDCPREWKSRYYPWRQEKDKTPAAGMALRDVLIAHALGYTLIPVGAGTETANSYADSIWCSGTFARWPLAYPRKFALATAAHTQLLDGAKFVRQVPTGSLTVYALEFAKDGGFVYALWSARGEVAVTGGAGALVGMTGRELGSVAAKDAVTVGEEPCYILASGKTDSFAAAETRSYPRERFPAMAKAVVAASAEDIAKVELRCVKEPRIEKGYDSGPVRVGRFEMTAVDDAEKGACVELRHVSKPACPEIMTEYATLVFKDAKPIEGSFSTLGVWVKGDSNWGKTYLEFEDAEGETWFSAGMGGVGCESYDWCARMSLNFDGWNFLQLPLTSLSPVKIPSPGDDEWQWTRDGSGNGQIDFPIKVKSVTIGQMGRTLDLLEMKSGGDSVRIKSVEMW